MTVENISWSRKNGADRGDRTRNLLITSRTRIQLISKLLMITILVCTMFQIIMEYIIFLAILFYYSDLYLLVSL